MDKDIIDENMIEKDRMYKVKIDMMDGWMDKWTDRSQTNLSELHPS